MPKIQKLIRMPKHIIKAIEAYQKNNGISTFTGSVLELLRKILESEGYL